MNTISPPSFGYCWPTIPSLGCGPVPVIPPTSNQGLGAQVLSLPGCIQPTTHTQFGGCPPPFMSLPGCVQQTAAITCTQASAQNTGPNTANQTYATVCTQIGCVHTHEFICPPVGPTAWHTCPPAPQQGGVQNTAATLCTWTGCPPHHTTAPIGHTGWYTCVPPTNGGGQAQAQTIPHTYMPGCPNTSTCSPQAYTGGFGCPNTVSCPPQPQGGQGQPYTFHMGYPNTSTCSPQQHTALIGCPNTSTCSPQDRNAGMMQANGGGQNQVQTYSFIVCPGNTIIKCDVVGQQPQAQTIWHTQPGSCFFSAPPQCGSTIGICTAADGGNGGGQGQPGAIFSAYTHCPTVPPMCPATSFNCLPANGDQAQTGPIQSTLYTQPFGYCPVSVPPHCPTVAPMCPPPAGQGGGQAPAQAQAITFLGVCPPTIPPTVCIATQIINCGGITGFRPFC
jgi:hypothetical protein